MEPLGLRRDKTHTPSFSKQKREKKKFCPHVGRRRWFDLLRLALLLSIHSTFCALRSCFLLSGYVATLFYLLQMDGLALYPDNHHQSVLVSLMLIHLALRDWFCMATCFVYHLFAARGPSYFLIAVLCFLRLTCLLSLLSVSERLLSRCSLSVMTL